MDRSEELALIDRWFREWQHFWFGSRYWPGGLGVDVEFSDTGKIDPWGRAVYNHRTVKAERGTRPQREEQHAHWLRIRDGFKTTSFEVAKLCRKHGIDCRHLISTTGGLAIDPNSFLPTVTKSTDEKQDQCWATVKELQLQLESGSVLPLSPSMIVDIARDSVTYQGQEYEVKSKQAIRWLKVLSDHAGQSISAADLVQYDAELDGVRTDRLRNYLPAVVAKLIESRPGGGSRFNLA